MYHGSCVDGDGLRSVIFFSGCNLRCPFCHNPETLYQKGKETSLEETLQTILRYKNYIKKGGVTLSGGEPFLQADFCIQLVKALKNYGIKVIAETNGTIFNEELISLLDGIRLDIKNQDNQTLSILMDKYEKFLSVCAFHGVTVTFTNVICPSVNDDKETVLTLKSFISKYAVNPKIEFLPFKKSTTSPIIFK